MEHPDGNQVPAEDPDGNQTPVEDADENQAPVEHLDENQAPMEHLDGNHSPVEHLDEIRLRLEAQILLGEGEQNVRVLQEADRVDGHNSAQPEQKGVTLTTGRKKSQAAATMLQSRAPAKAVLLYHIPGIEPFRKQRADS